MSAVPLGILLWTESNSGVFVNCPVTAFQIPGTRYFFRVLRITFRMAVIDTLINKIYVFDGEDSRLEIYCHAVKEKISCPLGKLSCSPKGQLARLEGFEPPALCLEGRCSILLSYKRILKVWSSTVGSC